MAVEYSMRKTSSTIADVEIMFRRRDALPLAGTDLASYLRVQGPLPPLPALAVTRQVLTDLGKWHALGIVHRDLKPDNVFIDTYGRGAVAKLMNFRVGPQTTAAGASASFVTPAYLSPEQIRGDLVDARSDLYSLGIMLFEMLTCQRPFESGSSVALLLAHLTKQPKRLNETGLTLSYRANLQAFLDRLLAKHPGERPSMLTALETVTELMSAITAGKTGSYHRRVRPAAGARRGRMR
jgi:serine/threonine-protein kinase